MATKKLNKKDALEMVAKYVQNPYMKINHSGIINVTSRINGFVYSVTLESINTYTLQFRKYDLVTMNLIADRYEFVTFTTYKALQEWFYENVFYVK